MPSYSDALVAFFIFGIAAAAASALITAMTLVEMENGERRTWPRVVVAAVVALLLVGLIVALIYHGQWVDYRRGLR